VAVEQARRTDYQTELLRLRLLHTARLLSDLATDVAGGQIPFDREGFILAQIERGESLADIGRVLGVSRQRVKQIAARAQAKSAAGG
jgi:hypothetical protein